MTIAFQPDTRRITWIRRRLNDGRPVLIQKPLAGASDRDMLEDLQYIPGISYIQMLLRRFWRSNQRFDRDTKLHEDLPQLR